MQKFLYALMLLPVCFLPVLRGQVQIGSTLTGLFSQDHFGESVAMSADGEILAVGAPSHDTNAGQSVGEVRVFNYDGADWMPMGTPLEGESEGDVFGQAVALSSDGQTLAVGIIGYDNSNGDENVGKVEVYTWDGSNWQPKGNPIEGDMINVVLGASVALSSSGDILAIGAPWYSANFQALSGRVWIYHWDGVAWQLESTLDGINGGEQFGTSLDFSSTGNILAVGAPQSNVSGSGLSGTVRIFIENGNLWEQLGNDLFGTAGSFFGTTLAVSADGYTIAIGAPRNNDNGVDAGQVRIFQWDGTTWNPMGSPLNGMEGSEFGRALTLSADGNALVVGSPEYWSKSGLTQYYLWNGSAWMQNGMDILALSAGAECGGALSISDNGDRIAVGSPKDSNASGYSIGSVRVFEICQPTASDISVTACQSYTTPSGNATYTESGIYTDEILNAAGCGDSIITIALTILHVDVSLANSNGTLTVGEENAFSYQWLDCNNNYAPIIGANEQNFTPSISGDYAVVVNANGCVDTSACEMVIISSTNEEFLGKRVLLFPNPAENKINVRLDDFHSEIEVRVWDLRGEIISRHKFYNSDKFSLTTEDLPAGFYVMELAGSWGEHVFIKFLVY